MLEKVLGTVSDNPDEIAEQTVDAFSNGTDDFTDDEANKSARTRLPRVTPWVGPQVGGLGLSGVGEGGGGDAAEFGMVGLLGDAGRPPAPAPPAANGAQLGQGQGFGAGQVGVKTRFGAVQEGTLLPGLHWIIPAIDGITVFDGRVQAYNFRIPTTRRPELLVPWPKPENYDPERDALEEERKRGGLLAGDQAGGIGHVPGRDSQQHQHNTTPHKQPARQIRDRTAQRQ